MIDAPGGVFRNAADLMQDWLGRILCLIGQHDYKVVEVTFGFGPTGRVEKVQCQRCGLLTTRSGEVE